MAKQSPHKQWKGCQLCKPHKNRTYGWITRQKHSVLKQLGAKRRVPRGFVDG